MEGRKISEKLNKKKSIEFIYGINSVKEALNTDKSIEKIFVKKDLNNPSIRDILKEATKRGIPVSKVPLEKLNRITTKNHQGIIVYVSPVIYANLHNILLQTYEKGDNPLFLILDQVTDIRNFGGIARTAESAGVNAIIIPEKGGPLITGDALKTSSGALNYIPVCREKKLTDSLKFLKDSGLKVIACSEKATTHLYEEDFKDPVALIMGAEDKGISSELLKLAEKEIKIPMHGNVKSLNVSVSTGIILYECLRQRIKE